MKVSNILHTHTEGVYVVSGAGFVATMPEYVLVEFFGKYIHPILVSEAQTSLTCLLYISSTVSDNNQCSRSRAHVHVTYFIARTSVSN